MEGLIAVEFFVTLSFDTIMFFIILALLILFVLFMHLKG